MLALLEEALCRRQALLRVDVVDNHDAIAGFDASLEHIARLVMVSFTYMRSEVDLVLSQSCFFESLSVCKSLNS